MGSKVYGMGFILTDQEAKELTSREPRNSDVIMQYLTGEDLNSRPDQSPSRYVINFFDWPLERAESYPDCISIVRERVKPEREKLIGRNPIGTQRGLCWWRYGSTASGLYRAVSQLSRVIAIAVVSRTVAFVFVKPDIVFSHKVVIFTLEQARYLAILQSFAHHHWAWKYSSTMKADLNYSSSDCFQNFPFPRMPFELDWKPLDDIGERYHEYRQQIMLARQEGLTKTYNRFHDPNEHSADISRLRALHVEMDQAVAAAYGWDDLELGYGFRETAQGVRHTISEPARREVLARLLALNHQRHTEEIAAGSHDSKEKEKDEDRSARMKSEGKKRGKSDGGKGRKKKSGRDEGQQMGML